MFIKVHVRGGYRAAAKYLANEGKNELTRLVKISDPDARNLEHAFHNMWLTACTTKAEKPLLHFSVNPFKDERLTDKQVKHIAKAYTAKCKMDIGQHQHVIVEHIKDGRQHFHVILNRVNQETGKAIDPGLYKKKARECAREMEIELELRRLESKPKAKRTRLVVRDSPYPTIKRKGKKGSGDGHGEGAATGLSAYKTTEQKASETMMRLVGLQDYRTESLRNNDAKRPPAENSTCWPQSQTSKPVGAS